MAHRKQNLELTWIGKRDRPKLEPCILIEEPERSYHAAHRVTDHDIFDNRVIFGDNLLALKALEQDFAGKVKCVPIDPPYNTGIAFEQHEDGLEHSTWFSLMPDTLSRGPEVWRVLSKCHDMRNRTEYEGVLDVDDRLVFDLIGACRKVASKVSSLPPIPKQSK